MGKKIITILICSFCIIGNIYAQITDDSEYMNACAKLVGQYTADIIQLFPDPDKNDLTVALAFSLSNIANLDLYSTVEKCEENIELAKTTAAHGNLLGKYTNEFYELICRKQQEYIEEKNKLEVLLTEAEKNILYRPQSAIDYDIKKRFLEWQKKSQFETTANYKLRLEKKSRQAFDSICINYLHREVFLLNDGIGMKWGEYNADLEAFDYTLFYGDYPDDIKHSIRGHFYVPIKDARNFERKSLFNYTREYTLQVVDGYVYIDSACIVTQKEGYLLLVMEKKGEPLIIHADSLRLDNQYLAGHTYQPSLGWYHGYIDYCNTIDSCNALINDWDLGTNFTLEKGRPFPNKFINESRERAINVTQKISEIRQISDCEISISYKDGEYYISRVGLEFSEQTAYEWYQLLKLGNCEIAKSFEGSLIRWFNEHPALQKESQKLFCSSTEFLYAYCMLELNPDAPAIFGGKEYKKFIKETNKGRDVPGRRTQGESIFYKDIWGGICACEWILQMVANSNNLQ